MIQLVVNADDFGLTQSVNAGIVEAHGHGILTSTTLLANGAAFDGAVEAARNARGLGVGVHLNLTEGRPVSNPRDVPSLVNAGGELYGGPGGVMRRLLVGQMRLEEVEREFAAQIEKVRRAGI